MEDAVLNGGYGVPDPHPSDDVDRFDGVTPADVETSRVAVKRENVSASKAFLSDHDAWVQQRIRRNAHTVEMAAGGFTVGWLTLLSEVRKFVDTELKHTDERKRLDILMVLCDFGGAPLDKARKEYRATWMSHHSLTEEQMREATK